MSHILRPKAPIRLKVVAILAVGDIVETLLPAMEKLKIATAQEVDLPTFRQRLFQEVTGNGSVIVGRSEIGIWTRTS